MSLERYDEAIQHYEKAAKHDPNNGNRYFDLGYALATNEKLAEAMKNFARAEEFGCAPENLVQLYNILGIICFDLGRHDDALVNLSKAEQLSGVNLDIMQRKAVIYGIKNDIRNGIQTANQIKLVAPSQYLGYQIAFKLLCQSKRFDDAEKELKRASKYTAPSMDYYMDCITFELEKYNVDGDKEHLNNALSLTEESLKTLTPTANEVVESYINAAEIYLQLENPDKTIECLNAAKNPVESFNLGFAVIAVPLVQRELTEYDIELMHESDKAQLYEKYGDYGVEELVASVEPDEYGNREYFTVIEDEQQNVVQAYKLKATDKIEYSPEILDQINRLYIGAYTLKKEFDKVTEYARKLQASESVPNRYIGMYAEANALKERDSPEATAKYEEIIKFFRNAMLRDPTDITAAIFRIQCYIDTKNYEEARRMCELLAEDVRTPLLDKIAEEESKEG
jgi:tetratricopeptide (TPR) repeat protein